MCIVCREMSSVAYEGYVSARRYYELSKTFLKSCTTATIRAPDRARPYDESLERVTSKFGRSLGVLEDGALISLKDEVDFELAIETAREHAKGKPEGKLEVWCQDA
ncbi:hypothetical protein EXIGLDRAFT_783772 [Exidia glandulosa HHB12029]|uniref:Uncharacterized protein n=1 Tax=Exidia glandulosa HHB12029 TaxID=1314781 RepID=A0A166MW81_EXIGL|nr:hypothetical protein EXIGLDRAFT_783772 [Exidia glandulosa HHB12029]